MKKPNGYNPKANVGEYVPVELGGHKCIIVAVKEQVTKGNQPQLVVGIDFAKEDAQAGYMKATFDADNREDKKWPYAGTIYIMENKYDWEQRCFVDEVSKECNDFLASVEQSNGIEINFDTKDFGKQFKGLKIGAVYGEEENEYNGKTSMLRKIRYFCTYDSALNKNVPKAKLLKKGSKPSAFDSAPVVDDEDVPF